MKPAWLSRFLSTAYPAQGPIEAKNPNCLIIRVAVALSACGGVIALICFTNAWPIFALCG